MRVDQRQLIAELRPHAEVRVFVPSRDRNGGQLPAQLLANGVERLFLTIADGVTTFLASGIWRNGSSNLIRESVLVVESYLRSFIPEYAKVSFVNGLARLAGEADQETLAVAIDGRLLLIEGERPLSMEKSNVVPRSEVA